MNFGVPLKVYSDRDPAYESELFQQPISHSGVKKLRTTGNNVKHLVYARSRIVKRYLLKYVTSVGGEWDFWINEETYAYNTSAHSSTWFSPVELMFGRKDRIPLDIMYGIVNSEGLPFNISEFKKKLEKMYELANENMNTRQSK